MNWEPADNCSAGARRLPARGRGAAAAMLLASLFFMTAGTICGQAQEERRGRLSGDVVDYQREGAARARGNVRLSYEEIEIFAESLEWMIPAGQVEATGSVRIEAPERELAGDSLVLDLAKESGAIVRARGRFRTVYLRADTIEFSPEKVVAHNARLTTCDRERPHYEIVSKRVIIRVLRDAEGVAAQGIKVSNARLRFGGRTLFSSPPFSFTRGGDREEGVAPSLIYPGYSRPDGIYLGFRWHLQELEEEPGPSFSAEGRFTHKRGLRGAVWTRYPVDGASSIELRLSRREDQGDGRLGPRDINTWLSEVMVNREPELAYIIEPRQAGGGLEWEAMAAAGHYRERPTGTAESRLMAAGKIEAAPVELGKRSRLGIAAAYRWARYGDKETARTAYWRVTAEQEIGAGTKWALSYVERRLRGATPFLFDAVELRRELASEAEIGLGEKWSVELLHRYDLQAERMRDSGLKVGYRAHCLEYYVGWRESRKYIELGVALTE